MYGHKVRIGAFPVVRLALINASCLQSFATSQTFNISFGPAPGSIEHAYALMSGLSMLPPVRQVVPHPLSSLTPFDCCGHRPSITYRVLVLEYISHRSLLPGHLSTIWGLYLGGHPLAAIAWPSTFDAGCWSPAEIADLIMSGWRVPFSVTLLIVHFSISTFFEVPCL